MTAQALSGTGSLRVGAEFLSKFHSSKSIYVCKPTWGNHNKIFPGGGLTVKQYRYGDFSIASCCGAFPCHFPFKRKAIPLWGVGGG